MSWNYSDWEEDKQEREHSVYVWTKWNEASDTLSDYDRDCTHTQNLISKMKYSSVDMAALEKFLTTEELSGKKHHEALKNLISQYDYESVLIEDYNISKEDIEHLLAKSKATDTLHTQNKTGVAALDPTKPIAQASPQPVETPTQPSFFDLGLMEDPIDAPKPQTPSEPTPK